MHANEAAAASHHEQVQLCRVSPLAARYTKPNQRENKWRRKEKRTTDPKSKEDPNIAARNHYGHIITRVCVSALRKDERTSALAASDAALESYEEEVNFGLSFADFGPFKILKNKVLLQTADDGDRQ